MKISAITLFRNNFVSKKNLKNNVNYVSQPSFNGILDVFKKQPKETTSEQKESDDIKDIIKSSIMGDKALKNAGKIFLKHLNRLLNSGKEKDYKGYLTYKDAKYEQNTVTFGDMNEKLGVPSTVNVWQEGVLKTVYEIESISPQSIYTITTYDENRECFYQFVNDKNLIFQSMDKDGTIVTQYPATEGFCQQVSEKAGNGIARFLYEVYWNYKNPEKSYVLYNTPEEAIRYGYDRKRKFWYETEIISKDKKHEIQLYTSEN